MPGLCRYGTHTLPDSIPGRLKRGHPPTAGDRVLIPLRPPIRMDIRWGDLFFALYRCLSPPWTVDGGPASLLRPWGNREVLVTLGVRSGLDLFLQALHLPRGSEVAVSAVTHPEMISLLRHHGLIPLPIDIDPSTLRPEPLAVQRAIGPRTRAVLVAHLFGTRFPLDGIAALCRSRGLHLIEEVG